MAHPSTRDAFIEPNHRQQMALERIEFAIGQLATALLSQARPDTATAAIKAVRNSVAPIIADILGVDR